MKFRVTFSYITAEQITATEYANTNDCFIDDYISADTAEEAADIAIDYIAEQINEIGEYYAETENDSVLVYDYDNEIVGKYYSFQAKAA